MIRPKKHIDNIYRTQAPESSRMDFLRLDKNEFLPCWPNEWFGDFLKTLRPEHLSIHPELAGLYKKFERVLNIPRARIVATAGSDAAIKAAFEVFVEPGDEVMIPNPTFAMYYVYAKIYQANLIEMNYDNRLQLDINRLIASINNRTKLIAIANPNSPTGTIIDKRDLIRIIEKASGCGASVLIDEAYYPFYEGTIIDLVDRFDNLIVTRTFSKAAGLAGMRVGFSVSNPKVAKLLFAVKPMYEITTLSALLAEYVLDHYERVFEYAKRAMEGKDYLADFFRKKGFEVINGYANFLHVDFGNDRDKIINFLTDNGVLFKDRFEHPSLERFSRFTVGPKESLRPLLEIFDRYEQALVKCKI